MPAGRVGPVRVAILCDYYAPGYKAGGPIQTLTGMVGQLAEGFEWQVVTRDRDLGDSDRYPNIARSEWNRVGNANVYYVSEPTIWGVYRALARSSYDILYLNSLFSPAFSLTPLLLMRLRILKRRPVILAPRGELSPSALRLKRVRKSLCKVLCKVFGIWRGILWHASNEAEAAHIRQEVSEAVRVAVAPNLAVRQSASQHTRRAKVPGVLRLVYLSRISRIKNLDGAIKILSGVSGTVVFHVVGPFEDVNYLAQCKDLAAHLPPDITVDFLGPVPNHEVRSVLSNYDLFFLPTHSENFGHAIVEALNAGTPVLVSDRTPWRGLAERSAGWDIELHDVARFRAVLQQCVDMDELSHEVLVSGARAYASQVMGSTERKRATEAMFTTAMALRAS
jgi:glycosyltransferase involved in cell wall biosynthesis